MLGSVLRAVLRQRRLGILLGVLLGAFFLYAVVKGVDRAAVARELGGLRSDIVAVCMVLVCVSIGLRAHRWGLIMAPSVQPGWGALVSLTWIGSLAVVMLPVRSGEFVSSICYRT